MKLFTNDTDYIVASDIDDAWKILVENNGGTREDFDNGDSDIWEMGDTAKLKIWTNAAGHPDEPHGEGNSLVEKTAAEWVAQEGRGFLCSTEF